MEENQEKPSFLENFKSNKTIESLNKKITTFKRVLKIMGILFSLSMIAYYIFALINNTDKGHLVFINGVTLALLIISFIGDQIYASLDKAEKKKNKQTKKKFSRTIKYLKHLVKIFATGFAVYEVIISDPTIFEILLTILSVIALIIQILISIATIVIEYSFKKIKEKFMTQQRFKKSQTEE